MKIYHSWRKTTLIISSLSYIFLFGSCNNNDDPLIFGLDANNYFRLPNELPANNDNPYDNSGKVFSELLESYYLLSNFPATIGGIVTQVEDLASTNSNFNAIRGQGYHAVSPARVTYFVTHSGTCLSEVIYAAPISDRAKGNLTAFTSALQHYWSYEDDYNVIYDFIATFESNVIADSQLNAGDRKTLLICSSITRYSFFAKKKKPKKNTDPDWRIFVCNISGAIEGSSWGAAEAVTLSLSSGVAENN